MADLLPHAGVDLEFWSSSGTDPAHAVGLVVHRRGTADRAADVGGFVLLPDLAVGVFDDVRGVGVDAEEPGDFGDDPGLLFAFADGALSRALPDVLCSAGQGPLSGVARRWSRIAPSSLTTRRLFAGIKVLALGAFGSW